MKRNFTDSSLMRSTAGCLPVPLFNQKKRTKQPLTSNPLKNDLSSNNSADQFNFSAMLADFGWETEKPEPIQLQKTPSRACYAIFFAEATTHIKADNASRRKQPEITLVLSHSRQEESTNVWKRNDFPAFGNRTENKKLPQLDDHPSYWMKPGPMYQKPAALPQASERSRTEAAEDWDPAVSQWPVKKPAGHSKAKEKENSLRILSAVIESMKHWSQYAGKTPLLFEVLGVLDSAVTPGQFGSKAFLLRDGKETVSCVFYEIDRELPRLIRGRVHRCMGNYDAKHKVFKCVSVRPATAAEQQTFQDFVKAADGEMCRFVKTSNEI
ncbi:spermatogenesis-associated protein 22 [Protobothrops mucrosquamatus]|uniref:spermatogenesis-associated protein 22 n=1 Tax=Protobothrops mucrosquamatus TaxID=103944 RepID=UPI0010FAF14A|nr:spermatogenesis-associated protein 22 [Protobothrops mucrosquamatus]